MITDLTLSPHLGNLFVFVNSLLVFNLSSSTVLLGRKKGGLVTDYQWHFLNKSYENEGVLEVCDNSTCSIPWNNLRRRILNFIITSNGKNNL